MKKFKQARQLPSRTGLQSLDKSQRSILDYAKATPIRPLEPSPNILQSLRKGPR
jgi:hypothetical protein